MQAVIALSLVLIFVIASLYLYSDLPATGARVETQSTRDRFDFAKQLLTTVGTLAVAVAGFYFGARSVEAAQQSQREGATGTSGGADSETGGATTAITITEPSSPARLHTAPGIVLAPIRVETTPAKQRVIAFVASGDDDGRVEQVAPGEFQYVRGSAADANVTLTFQLPDGTARVDVEVRAPSAP